MTNDTSRREAGSERIRFEARPVLAIRIIGLASTASKTLYVTQLEAFCIPPSLAP